MDKRSKLRRLNNIKLNLFNRANDGLESETILCSLYENIKLLDDNLRPLLRNLKMCC